MLSFGEKLVSVLLLSSKASVIVPLIPVVGSNADTLNSSMLLVVISAPRVRLSADVRKPMPLPSLIPIVSSCEHDAMAIAATAIYVCFTVILRYNLKLRTQ